MVIRETSLKAEKTLIRIHDEVESGALDPFWAIHFDTLVYVGVVS